MKKTKWMLLAWILLLGLNTVFAKTLTIPKFSIIPIVKAPPIIAANGVAVAQYFVTNNTFVPRTLTLSPVAGVVPITTLPGGCTNPFFLGHNQSCLLSVFVAGSLLPSSGLHSGPVVCKTMGPGNNNPDPFLCSQVAPGGEFNVNKTQITTPSTIVTSTTSLTFSTGVGGVVTVTNTSTNASADNIVAALPPGTNFTATSGCPQVLLPGASCQISFNSNVPAGPDTATIQGSNTNPVNVTLTAVMPTITVTAPLGYPNFTVGNGITFTVQNTSANTASALDVTGVIPTGSPLFVAANTCPSILPPGAICHIAINSLVRVTSAGFVIQGANTNAVPLTLTAVLAEITASTPPPFLVNTTTASIVTVGVIGPALNISAQIPPGSAIRVAGSDCLPSLPSGATCTILFTSPTPETTVVTISGTNTNPYNIVVTAQIGTISVSPTTLGLTAGLPEPVTVTNNSPYTLHNIAAFPPAGSLITTDSSNCALAPLPPGGTCVISFRTETSLSTPVVVPIFGSDTNRVSVSVTSTPVTICFLPGCTTSATVSANGSATVQVLNSSNANALEVGAVTPPNVTSTTTCPSVLPPLGTCTITFAGSGIFAGPINIPVNGLNTNQIVANVVPYTIILLPNNDPVTLHVGIPSQQYSVYLAPGQSGIVILSINFSGSQRYTIGDQSLACNSGITAIIPCNFRITGVLPGAVNLSISGQSGSVTPFTNVITLPLNIVTPWQAILKVNPSAGTINLDDPAASTVFTLTNESSSAMSASEIKAKLPKDWKNVTATIAEDCNGLAPGASCQISFASTSAYVAKGEIEISSEDAEPVKIALGFIKDSGLVFDIDDKLTKIVSLEDLKPLLESDNKDFAEMNAQICKNYNGAGFINWTLADNKDLIKIDKSLSLLGLAPEANHLNCMRTLE